MHPECILNVSDFCASFEPLSIHLLLLVLSAHYQLAHDSLRLQCIEYTWLMRNVSSWEFGV